MGKTVGLCVVFITLVVGMFVYSVTRTQQLSDEELSQRGVFTLPRPRDIAPFELTNHIGDPFTNANLKGRWTFMFFGFTHCPDICPTTLAVMALADRELRNINPGANDSFQGVLVSVDPQRDTNDKLGPYITAFSQHFLGVTSDRAKLAEIATQLNVAFAKVPDDQGGYSMDHTGNIVIINPMGHYYGFIKMPHTQETIRLTYQSLAGRI
ncbi:MAG: SCO family protein [Gammaproteobacteria bacterium]|nr:SCO family protein [Gammaproteobacteria bacterium]